MKIVQLTEKQKKETEILSKRIMPKNDFIKVIEHDKVYYNALNQALEFNIIKQDILRIKCEKILNNQTKELITENIDMLCDWAETQVKIMDMQGKLRIQQTLIDDKQLHFDNVFMPQFNKELEDALPNYLNIIKEARELVKTKKEYFEDMINKITYELTWWDKCSSEQQKNEEYIIQIYKPLKRLINAWKLKEESQK